MSGRVSSRAHSSRVVIAESWRDVLGTRRFVLLGLVLTASLYYYFFVHHATPVRAATAAPTMTATSHANVQAEQQAQRIVVKLDGVKTAQQRLGAVDPRLPRTAADPAPSIDDILQHAAGPSDVMCTCVASTAAASLHAQKLSAQAAAQSLPTAAGYFRLNLTAARAALPKGAASTRAHQIRRSGNVADAHLGRVLPTHSAADEVAAQLAAYNAAQRLLHPSGPSTGVLSALEIEADIDLAMLELAADLSGEQSEQRWDGGASACSGVSGECGGLGALEEDADPFASPLSPRSVDDLMRDFRTTFADDIRSSSSAAL